MEEKGFKVEIITNGEVCINEGKSIIGVNKVVIEEMRTTGL